MRRGELLGLRWSDVDLDTAAIYVNQSLQRLLDGRLVFGDLKTTKSRRRIAMTPSLTVRLFQHRVEQETLRSALGKPLAEQDLVFTYPDGSPLNPETVSPAFRRLVR